MKNITKYLLTVILTLALTPAFAQSIYSIKLHLTDEKTSEPVAFATASVTVKGEKSPFKYTLTDDKGDAVLTKLKKGTYILKAELMGYKTYTKEVLVDKNVDLGVIKMAEDAEVLDAAKVTDMGNPIIIKKDTVEYNASSFKTSDNDMLEQLLKKLPGIEIGTDGSITANGETIKKITIDGKTFFLDDPQLASKNIPAKIIEKVKVVEKKSDQAMFTGIDDGEEETIIDLKLRPGMAKGWFGNIMAGGGHDVPGPRSDMNDFRYQGAAMVGRFVDKSQISIILNGNNTNNRGFNDIAGGMMGNMRGGRGMGRGQGAWGGNSGISTTWLGGVNGAFGLCDGDMNLDGHYLYNGSNKDLIEETSKITYMEDGSRLLNDSKGTNNTFSQGHRFGVRLDHKFSENTSIIFEPQFNFGSGSYSEYSDFNTGSIADGSADTLKVNKGYTSNEGRNKNWAASGFLLFRQRLGKPGRTISANVRYNFSNNDLNGLNKSLTQIADSTGMQWADESDKVDQSFTQNSTSSSVNGRLVYTEPLTEYLFLEANYQYNWSQSHSNKETIDVETGLRNEDYSNDIYNRGIAQRAGLSLSFQKKKLRAQLGASVNPTNTRNKTNGVDTTIKVLNWSPQAMFNYEINDNSNLRFFYFGRSSQPSTSQLMPVLDNSDPLNMALGNPYLEPYFNHNIRSRFSYSNKKTFFTLNGGLRGTFVQNAITSAQWYDQNRVQYSLPVNGPADKSFNLNLFINTPFAKSNFSMSSMTFANYNESTSYIGVTNLNMDEYFKDAAGNKTENFNYALFHLNYGDDITKSGDFKTNHTQTIGVTQRLEFKYRNDDLELKVAGRTRVNKSWYTMKNSQLDATWNNQVEGALNWTIPFGMNIIAEAQYNWYNGNTTPQESDVVLNAEITQLIFKKKFTLALKAYDILGQSKNLSVTDATNYHLETRNNTLGRYIILSLTYRFGKFNGNKGGQQRGPGGFGGHRGPGGFGGPMGGPPRH